MNQSPYQMLGEEGVRRLANEFYRAMDETQEAADIRAMHGKSLDEISQKLFEYLSGWLGGPSLYADKYGTVCLTDPHKGYAIGESERDQWLHCMDLALLAIDAEEPLKAMLKQPFFEIADMITNTKA